MTSGSGSRGPDGAPADKVVGEWVLVEGFDADRWDALVRKRVAFVS